MNSTACHILATGAVLALCSCGRTTTGQPSSAPDWVQHNDPAGFTLKHPAGWVVSRAQDGCILVTDRKSGCMVLVQPYLAPPSETAEQRVRHAPTALAAHLPKAKLIKASQQKTRPDEVIASLSYEAPSGEGTATLYCSLYGRSGMLYAIAAPKDAFAEHRPHMVRILESLRFTGTSQQARTAPDASLTYERWVDPKEGAFSIEVPKGWKVTGGIFRFAPVDVRSCVVITSPDGAVRIAGGDSELPTFSIPFSPLFPEGSWYSPGYGVRMKVSRYLTGQEFVKAYVTSKIGAAYSDLVISETRDRAEFAREVNALNERYAALGVTIHMTAGDVAFTCRSGDTKLRGYYFAATSRVTYQTGSGAGGIWSVPYIYGYVAPPEKVELAQAIVNHAVRSIRLNPQWVAMQQGINAESSRIVSETHSYISKVIDDSYWNRERVRADLSRKWSNAILGQTDVTDPETGETWKVESGHNYYWRKEHTDTVVGTETYTRPDTDFSPLLEW